MIWSWSNKQQEETFLCLHGYNTALHVCTRLAAQYNFKQSHYVFTWTTFFRGMEHTYVSCVIYRVPCVEHTYGHVRNSHAWNTRGHTGAINICYSPAINLQKHIKIQSTTVNATHIVHS